MARPLSRKLAIAGLLGIVGFTTACPPPWYFWRHERREERHERRGDRRDDQRERHDDHKERHGDHKERHDDRGERR